MPKIYRRLIHLISNGWAWVLDYMYVAYWQLYSFFIRNSPQMYAAKHPSSAQKDKVPIILIPGIYENWRFMKPISNLLHRKGYPIFIVDGLGYNTGDVKDMAAIVAAYIESMNLKQCIIVAHSKGGLVGKYLLANLNEHKILKGMVAINTPFSGSNYAYFMPLKSLRVFLPNSSIISLLAANRMVNEHIVSIFGLFDPHIPGGSYLEGAKNIQLNTRGHFRIMKNLDLHQAIIDSLEYLSTKK